MIDNWIFLKTNRPLYEIMTHRFVLTSLLSIKHLLLLIIITFITSTRYRNTTQRDSVPTTWLKKTRMPSFPSLLDLGKKQARAKM